MDISIATAERVLPYNNGREHLADLLLRLDLWIRRDVILHRQQHDAGDSWAGFVAITNREVDTLLSRRSTDDVCSESVEETKSIECTVNKLSVDIDRRVAASIRAGIALPMVELVRIFGLSSVEACALMACLGPEIDRRYERLYGYLHDDMSRRLPSIGLILDFCRQEPMGAIPLRTIFASQASLIKYQLLRIVNETPGGNSYLSRPIQIDSRIASFLLGEGGVDHRIQDNVAWYAPDTASSVTGAVHGQLVDKLITAAQGCLGKEGSGKKPVFYLHGRPGMGKQSFVRVICQRLQLPLLVVDAEQVAASAVGLNEGMFLAFRESLLCQAVLYIQHLDRVLEQNQDRFRLMSLMNHVRSMGGITFLSGEKAWSWRVAHDRILFLPVELRFPGYDEQVEVWKSALQGQSELDENAFLRLVSKYPSSPGQIEDAAMLARTHAALRDGSGSVTQSDVEESCRAQCVPDFGSVARKIEAKHAWEDLILPSPQMNQLREICNHVYYRSIVYGAWGFGRKLSLGKGMHALFSGPSGTGKTMAAEVIANELRLDMYQIDLSQIVSKYIGETEKNLHHIFREAQKGQAILFFDEADALLGKRSEVRDAHDRYANLEVAYLLQKMEEHEGITILSTNLRQNMDAAFTRRIRFIVEFPFPEEEHRLVIWRGVWPKETPLSRAIDFPFLAKRFKLTGGNIRNIALAAAYLASSNGQCVEMKHLLSATKQEFLKMGRLIDENEYLAMA